MAKRLSEEWRKKISDSVKRCHAEGKYLSWYRKGKKWNHPHPLKKSTYQRKNIRNGVIEERGRKCERCGWAEINPYNGKIPVQINHINGNKQDNRPENIEILCPNCHSLTKYYMFYGRKHFDKKRCVNKRYIKRGN